MSLVRSVVLVDGENLTMRYQALVAEGRKPKAGITHIRDVCVWIPFDFKTVIDTDVIRINYYTSMVGDDPAIEAVKAKLAELCHQMSGDLYGWSQLLPRVFKKPRQSTKSRLVDINITIDAMRHAYANAIDVIYIFSGDGDFLSLVEEIGKAGKKVVLSAFSSGLEPKLKTAVDRFVELDDTYFEQALVAATTGNS